ncbi:MAG: ABC transporter permease [Candidatus Woesearchaeota archaeon]|jgi:ABC-type multidrug transport system permease subunit/cob(I)alamin adenosyltransferase|nr:ABC transporter permease [Candidatus Woesearchaeota archaeon]MDP7199137.1 ABC transporter permease [Candidatus Woesearchaeota archaeon]MDP7467600.1 ABC transporter permease [Candidatus Woesearchaeota archaeon]MDP7647082.1 ABC transporter permease [Candidatus Woesearchaeota archaeon]
MITYLQNIGALIRKNVLVLVRARASALVVLLGPLLLILLAGLAFDNTNTYAVSVGTYSESYNELSNAFVERLSQNRYQLTRYDALNDCKLAIRKGEAHLCVEFPKDMTVGKNASMIFYVDHSRMNLVWTIVNVMTKHVMEGNFELTRNLTSNLLDSVAVTEEHVIRLRPVVVQMTTDNEANRQDMMTMQAELMELNTNFAKGDFQIDELATKKQIVKQWIENAVQLGEKSLKDAESFINVAHQSTASNEDVQTALAKAVADLEKQRKSMDATTALLATEFEAFSTLLAALVEQVEATDSQIQEIARVQGLSGDALRATGYRLDRSLLGLLDIQQSLNIIDNQIDDLAIRDAGNIAQPIETVIKPVVAEKTYLQYLFPVLILLVIMFTSVILPPTLIMIEKKSPAVIRNYLTPTKSYTYMLATFISIFLMLLAQLIVVLLIAALFFKTQIIGHLPETVFVLAFTASIFVLAGMLIGYLFNTEETAMLASVSLAILSLLMSEAIIPIETMPTWLISLSKLSPFVIGSNLLRQTLVFDGLTGTGKGVLTLFIYIIIMIFVCWMAYSADNRRMFKTVMGEKVKKFKNKKIRIGR